MLLAACSSTTEVARLPVGSITVQPASASLEVNQSVLLQATVRDSGGTVLGGREVFWTSDDSTVASVNATGLVTALRLGAAHVAASAEGVSAIANIAVVPPPVSRVTVSPPTSLIAQGATVQLTAVPYDAAGNALSGRATTWASSTPGVATVSATGLVTGRAAGTAVISATIGGVVGTAGVAVLGPPVASLVVTPASATIQRGNTLTLNAIPRDAAGNVLTGRAVTWSSSDTSIATVSTIGVVTGIERGTAIITATCEGKTASATIRVR